MLDTFRQKLLKPLLNMGIIFGSADEIVLLIRRSLVRAQVEEPQKSNEIKGLRENVALFL